MKASYLLLFLVILGVATCEECTRHGVRCLDYTVTATHESYEERQYPSLVWVSTSAKAKTRNEVSRMLVKRLYSYLAGRNDKSQRMEMMVPFRTTKVPGEGMNTYSMAIPLASEYREDPPKPKNNLVKLLREPPKIYYARSFIGLFREESKWDDEAQALRNSLGGHAANATFYYRCAYDPPWVEEDRLNEVWLSPSQ